MKTKKLTAILLALLMVVVLTGCNKSKAPSSGGGEERVSLDFYFMCNDFYDGALEMVRQFERLYPNVSVDLAQLTTASCAEALQPRAAAGALPDVMSIDADTFGSRVADEGLLVDLNNYPAIKANVIPALIGPYTSAGGVFYAVAGGLATNVLYYNKDIFASAGITQSDTPANFEELLALLGKLRSAGQVPLICPASVTFSSFPNTFWTSGMATNFMAQGVDYGKQIMDGTFNFNVPGYIDIYAKVKRISDLNYFIRGVVSLEYQQATDAFCQGAGAILYGGNWLAGPIFATADFPVGILRPTLNNPGQKIGYALGVETGFGAAKNSKEEWSMKFMDFIVNGDGFYIYQNARANQPYIVNANPSRLVMEKEVADYMSEILNDSSAAFGPFWFQVLKSEMFSEIPITFSQVLSNELTPEQAARNFNDAYRASF